MPPVPEATYLLSYLDQHEEAISHAKWRVDMRRGGQSLMFLGIAYAYAGQLDEAIENMRAFLGDFPPEQVNPANLSMLVLTQIGRGNAASIMRIYRISRGRMSRKKLRPDCARCNPARQTARISVRRNGRRPISHSATTKRLCFG